MEGICKKTERTPTTDLPRGLDAFDHGKADKSPSGKEAASESGVQASTFPNGICHIQSVAVPEIGGGRTALTLSFYKKEQEQKVMQGLGETTGENKESFLFSTT